MDSADTAADEQLLMPLTIERVAAVLREQDLEFDAIEGAIRTGFYDAAIGIVVHEGTLLLDARWRGEPSPDQGNDLLQAAHEWNVLEIKPTMYVGAASGSEDGVEVHLQRALPALNKAGGYTHNQLGLFVVSFFTATATACDYLANSFPDLVTWERPEAEPASEADAPAPTSENDNA
ncbi:YbjN domain-containing protein [Corynebacterium sp. TAE3-ERU30]|uniref:YbjN domain-containing protein n=1 Tax=Corynebacterium sp. TAE3-ERU30 TaxID=2849496 RepID=UPI001C4975C5|nr:YbjN domain-containing protein [Corynebacterium sp. TAE3-ERU30]MBV7280982.1 YbjN domain-containing protein [Corynebacterium sp. TAE3-ERU30]